jgi:hypothetical protein
VVLKDNSSEPLSDLIPLNGGIFFIADLKNFEDFADYLVTSFKNPYHRLLFPGRKVPSHCIVSELHSAIKPLPLSAERVRVRPLLLLFTEPLLMKKWLLDGPSYFCRYDRIF